MSYIGDYEIIEETGGYALLQNDNGERTVVGIDRQKSQVYSAVPGDLPTGGGLWCARIGQGGVDYVSNFYSRSWANRTFRRLTSL